MLKVCPALALVLLSAVFVLAFRTHDVRLAAITVDPAAVSFPATAGCAGCPGDHDGAAKSGMCEQTCPLSPVAVAVDAGPDRSPVVSLRHDLPPVGRRPDGWRGPPDPFPPKGSA